MELMKKLSSPTRNTERGQSLVELGISLMVLLMLLTGAVEISLALFQYVTIRDAAQEGALYGSINPTDTAGIQYRAQDTASDVVQVPVGNITITTNNGQLCEGSVSNVPNAITVSILFVHPITFPLVAPMIGQDTINLHASATNTILQPTCPLP